MIEHLIVCGDSFMAPSLNRKYLNTHWSELLSSKLKLKLINLAQSGCTNRMVTFQILESLKYENSLTIIMAANHFIRFDLLTDENKSHSKINDLRNFFITQSLHKDYIFSQDAFIISKNMHEIEDEGDQKFLTTRIPWDLFRHIDNWGLFYSLSQLKTRKKKFLFLTGNYLLDARPYSAYEFVDFFGPESIVDETILYFKKYAFDKTRNPQLAELDPGYHTFPADQIIISDIIEKVMFDRGLISE